MADSHTPHATRNDLAEDVRSTMVQLLNAQLADSFDLYSHTKQAHWNVKGMQFIALHELFDALAEELEAFIDTIAERAVSLGGNAQGTVRMAAQATRLAAFPAGLTDAAEVVKVLAGGYAALAATTREAITVAAEAGDDGTSDVFTEVVRGLDKSLWFLEAHLQ